MFAIGMWMTYASSYLNISSTAGKKYDWMFYDPYFFYLWTALEYFKIISSETALVLFVLQATLILMKYIHFMTYVTNSLCAYLGIKDAPMRKKNE